MINSSIAFSDVGSFPESVVMRYSAVHGALHVC